MAKGGGSANKSLLFQETKALLTPAKLAAWLDEKLRTLGTAACPPYHLALVIGGTSAEYALKTAKYASARYLDTLPDVGLARSATASATSSSRPRCWRSRSAFGIGAQFGGKYFCHDVRVIRLPRHGASLPGRHRRVVLGRPPGAGQDHRRGRVPRAARDRPGPVPARGHRRRTSATTSCASTSPGRWTRSAPSSRSYPVKTRLSLTGPMVVARDIAHAKITERLDAGEAMPAVPARPLRLLRRAGQDPGRLSRRARSGRPPRDAWTPTSSGSRPPAARYVMLAKGNRSKAVTDACAAHGGFYLGLDRRPGGPPGPGLHPQGRGARVPRARHGGGVAHRGRGLPRLHRRRRQGQRLLPTRSRRPSLCAADDPSVVVVPVVGASSRRRSRCCRRRRCSRCRRDRFPAVAVAAVVVIVSSSSSRSSAGTVARAAGGDIDGDAGGRAGGRRRWGGRRRRGRVSGHRLVVVGRAGARRPPPVPAPGEPWSGRRRGLGRHRRGCRRRLSSSDVRRPARRRTRSATAVVASTAAAAEGRLGRHGHADGGADGHRRRGHARLGGDGDVRQRRPTGRQPGQLAEERDLRQPRQRARRRSAGGRGRC